MISASNYVDVYTACRLSNIFLIKDKLYERKIAVALVQQWERGNGGSRQTDVPCKENPHSPTALKESLPRWLLELQARRAWPHACCQHHFSKSNLKMNLQTPGIIPHPLFLSSSQHLSLCLTSFIFPMWDMGRLVGASSFKFLWVRLVFGDECLLSWVSGAPPCRFIMLATMDGIFLGLSWIVLPWVWIPER